MVRDICLVINNTDREIQVGEYWKKYLPDYKDTAVSPLQRAVKISRNGFANIEPAEFIKRYDDWKRMHNADRCKWVFLSDDSEKGVVLSKTDIHDSIGFVITIEGKNNQLVKEPVSKMESESTGKRNESEKELKNRLISIVKNRKNVSAGLSLENRDPGKKKNASADPSQEGKGKNCVLDGQNNTSADPSRGGKVENSGHDGQKNASANPSRGGKVENSGHNGQKNASADPSQGGKGGKSSHSEQNNAPSQEGNGKTSARVSET